MNKHETLIAAETMYEHRDNPQLRVIDCRFNLLQPEAGFEAYLAGHIPGAVYANLDSDLAGPVRPDSGRHPLPESETLAETLGQFGIAPATQVVVYDDASGAIATRAWWLLHWLGHRNVAILDGGIKRWTHLGLPTESGEVTVEPRVFTARPRPELVLETAELVAAGNSAAALQLVDARDASRFRGEHEPIDAVAGHIPGAVNLPYDQNLNGDGTWRSAADLRQLWSEVLGSGLDRPWGVMCGSGVTACHHVVSSLRAGLREPRVYIGSWSEWIRDPQRSVAKGPV